MATNKERLTANNALIDQAQALADTLPDAGEARVDNTLTIPGAAADAAATGAKISQLSDEISSKAGGIIETTSGEVIMVSDSANAPLQGLAVYGKSTQDGTPAPDAPVDIVSVGGDDGSAAVTVCGANVIPFPYSDSGKTSNGITWTVNPDGSITASGTATATSYFVLSRNIVWHTVSFDASAAPVTKSGKTFSGCRYNSANKQLFLQISSGDTVSGKTFYPTANYGETALPWEAARTPQILSISTPDGLCGIPVASGGNYTDADGQMWVCDTVDFGRGARVQRIGRIDSYSGEETGDVWMSSTGSLATGAAVLYPLAEPIETPLTEDELAAYRELYTHKPVTTIYADDNAGLSVDYTADTKTYIDRKFAELASAIVNA